MIDPEVIALIAENKIREAVDEGKFDNLPGKGQPLIFEDDPSIPLDVRMSNKVLKNAGALPDWMMVQRDIIAEREAVKRLRANLVKEHERRRQRLRTLHLNHPTNRSTNRWMNHPEIAQFAEWHAISRASYLRRLKGVNTSILKLSMMAPSTVPGEIPYRIEQEMAEFDTIFPVPDTVREATKGVSIKIEEPEGQVKNLARARYEKGGGQLSGWARAARLLGFGNASAPDNHSDLGQEDIRRADAPERE